ncbi:MAG: hypothetical protein RhofKO_10650 [Rhodothermales bacterium]
MPPSKPHLILGIDPGTTTGLAAYYPSTQRLTECTSAAFWQVLHLVRTTYPPEGRAGIGKVAAVIVEDARSLPLYARHRNTKREARDRVARNVGRVDMVTTLIIEWLQAKGYHVQTETPQRRKKWDADTLARLTGYTLPTNEHGRDAARLVVGRSVPPRMPVHPNALMTP